MARKKLSNEELLKCINDSIEFLQSATFSERFIELDEPPQILEKVGSTQSAIKTKKRSLLFRLFGKRIVKDAILQFETVTTDFPGKCMAHNEWLAHKQMQYCQKEMPLTEGKPLDEQQLYSITYDVHNRLVVAGAGTGKTTTIIGLVKYLLNTGVKPEELLLLSFTNASVDELKERILKETECSIHTSTFHKLGLDILADAGGKRPNITHLDLNLFLAETLKELCREPEYYTWIQDYLSFDRESAEESASVVKIRTKKGETVKSYGEKYIADFLYSRNIKYVYEESYCFDTSDETHGQYHPDFHISGTDIYIEYFGINREGKVAPFITSENGDPSEEYCKGIAWKTELHKSKGTRLIPLYFYQFTEGSMLDELQILLEQYGVKCSLVPDEDLILAMEINHTFQRLASQFVTSVTLLKGRNLHPSDLEKRADRKMRRYLRLLGPLFDAYQNYLAERNEIDFEDMLNKASDEIERGRYVHPYKYVIVDEYQDISTSRYRLLKTLRESQDYRLYCVGDDWQSIYRFNGSDIGYILDFEKYWGPTKVFRIERTYRFAGRLLEISGEFIQRNGWQLKKDLHGAEGMNTYLGVVNVPKKMSEGEAIERKLDSIEPDASVLILGRYTFDADLMPNAVLKKASDGSTSVLFNSRPDLKITFRTAHGSKGLQADYVFIINCRANSPGFPNDLDDSPLLPLLLETKEDYPYAEERRLFYVAMTRARKGAFLVLRSGNISEFVNEVFCSINPGESKAQK